MDNAENEEEESADRMMPLPELPSFISHDLADKISRLEDADGLDSLMFESYGSEQAIPTGIWHSLGYHAVCMGRDNDNAIHIDLLDRMIRSKKLPPLVEHEKIGTLLHCAVMVRDVNVVAYLLDHEREGSAMSLQDILGLVSTKNPEGLTPLEYCVKNGATDMIEYFLGKMERRSLGMNREERGAIEACLKMEEITPRHSRSMQDLLYSADLAHLESQLFYRSTKLEEIRKKAEAFKWWPRRQSISWNLFHQRTLYFALMSAADSRNYDVLKWICTEFQVSTRPSALQHWNGKTVSDRLLIGRKGRDVHNVEAMSCSLTKCFDDTSDIFSFSFLYSRMMVELLEDWDGSFSQFLSKFHKLDKWLQENRKRNSELSPLDQPVPMWYETLQSLSNSDGNSILNAIKALAERFAQDGPFCMPRLDLAVIRGMDNVLQWCMSKNFINLSDKLDKHDEDVSQHEESAIEDEADVCAICLCEKRHEEAFTCQHTFCGKCVARLRNTQKLRCPLCRESVSISLPTSMATSFAQNIAVHYPFLEESNSISSLTVGEAALGLAIASEAISVLEFLKSHVDIKEVVFSEHQNAMHFAVSRGAVFSCAWLCTNGFINLSKQRDKSNQTPIDLVFQSQSDHAHYFIKLFLKYDLLPDNWKERSWACQNEEIVGMVRDAEKEHALSLLNEMIASHEPVERIKALTEKYFVYRMTSIFVKENIIGPVIQSDRSDIIEWLVTDKHISIKSKECQEKANKLGVILGPNLVALFEKLEEAEARRLAMWKSQNEYQHLIEDPDATLSALKEAVQRYHNKYLELNEEERKSHCNLGEFKGFTEELFIHRTSSIEYSIQKNRPDFAIWMMEGGLFPEKHSCTQHLFDYLNEDGLSDCSCETLQTIFNWIKAKKFDLNPLGSSILFHLSYDADSIFEEEESICDLEAIEMNVQERISRIRLLSSYGISANIVDERNESCLFHVHASLRGLTFLRAKDSDTEAKKVSAKHLEIIGKAILRLIQAFAESGAHLTCINEEGRSFMEKLVFEPLPGIILPTIRWLAIERGISIQYLKYGRHSRRLKIPAEEIAEFECIQKEQAQKAKN